jgi:hypothetical protein
MPIPEDTMAEILAILKRIEERQIATTKMVTEIEQEEKAHTVGSFGTVDTGKD